MKSRLTEFTPGNRYFESQIRLTYAISWVSIAIPLVIILASPSFPGNIYWFFFGFATGLFLIFHGSVSFQQLTPAYSSRGFRLHESFDRWFPFAQFWFRQLFIAICLLALWFQFLHQGLPSILSINILLGLILLLLPIHTLSQEKFKIDDSPRQYRVHELIRFSLGISIALLLGFVAQAFVFPPGEDVTSDISPVTVLIWVPSVLYILSSTVLLADRMIQAGKPR